MWHMDNCISHLILVLAGHLMCAAAINPVCIYCIKGLAERKKMYFLPTSPLPTRLGGYIRCDVMEDGGRRRY